MILESRRLRVAHQRRNLVVCVGCRVYELVQRRHNPSLHFGLGLRLGLRVRAEVGVSRVCKTDLTLVFF